MHAVILLFVGWFSLGLGTPASARQAATSAAPAHTAMYEHVIVPGDTLIGLGHTLLARPSDWREIRRLNRVRDPRRLRPGRSLMIPVELMRHLPGSADVEWVRGTVRVHGQTGESVAALTGASVTPGQTIETAAASSVGLRLTTGAGVTLGERARVTFIEMRSFPDADSSRTVLEVERGRLHNRVVPSSAPGRHYEIRTPVVSIAVRGTGFRVDLDEGATRALTEVDEGVVGLAVDAVLVAVEAGFGSVTPAGSPPGPPRQLLPPPTLARESLDSTGVPPRLRWPALAGATTYRVVTWSEGRGAQLDDQIVATPEVAFPLPDGTYEVTVRGIEADGLEGSDAVLVLVLATLPPAPIAQAPVAGTVLFGDRVTLQWTRPPGAVRFDVQVAHDATFGQPVLSREGHGALSLVAPLAPGEYYWRVASRDGSRLGAWSDGLRFTLKAVPPEGPPAGLDEVSKRELTLRWAMATQGDRYAVQLARDVAFSDLLAEGEVDEPAITVDRPVPGTYYVRVRIVNAEGTPGPFGEPQSFTVPKPPRSRWWWLLAPAAALGAVLAAR